ncbi:hypothetical protein Aph02nite_27980 [Actinoplanes philippinensis]|uniref:Uncharacterized protein n=1 Tax=Actinoplanes philippinensis TaxID=35752 RepID=A0A1I2GFL2_9ACTN|nr:hypothetical protein [Actinoplanes philippinensis]GIE76848.1 hypothetical protein Aph02nite_27980 [Actinoplanes philippinensis]SFF15431.1 hypothetical protein SAMN05421541_106453 [Actinoplanes philippinensis]
MRMRATTTTVALIALLAGGCARPGDGPGAAVPGPQRSGPAAPVVHDRWESCDAALPKDQMDQFTAAHEALTMPLLDDSFQPVAAVVCRVGIRQRPGGGSEQTAEEARADDLTALLSALRLPDEASTAEICTADLPGVPWVVLVDRDNRWVRPGVPVDACVKPRTEFRKAYDGLVTVTVSSRVTGQIESDEAATAGCSQTYADMTWTTGAMGSENKGTLGPLPETASARRCVYDVPASERGSGKPAGGFRAGGPLSAADWTAIRAEVAASEPASPACDQPASRFALVQLEPGGTLNIEADGCRRILAEVSDGPGVFRTSSERLTKLVFG